MARPGSNPASCIVYLILSSYVSQYSSLNCPFYIYRCTFRQRTPPSELILFWSHMTKPNQRQVEENPTVYL